MRQGRGIRDKPEEASSPPSEQGPTDIRQVNWVQRVLHHRWVWICREGTRLGIRLCCGPGCWAGHGLCACGAGQHAREGSTGQPVLGSAGRKAASPEQG